MSYKWQRANFSVIAHHLIEEQGNMLRVISRTMALNEGAKEHYIKLSGKSVPSVD